nr:PREDICTED: zinc finger protein RFP [Anolis carolinensis]|eukprot:XP_008104093.1 PREDICTED: zinc finger protein RFP [Anolis carolinensis]
MASGEPMKKLCEQLACRICMEYFKKPVILSCGHNFCQSCLDRWWERRDAYCPQCREEVQEGDIRPNRQLANVVELVKELESQKAEEKGRVCQWHQEPLKLFCKDHEAPISVVCDRSKVHENHKVIPLVEASKEYKIWNFLETLEKEGENILAHKADAAWESQDLLKKTQRQKDRTVAAFRHMHQFLEEQERNLLAKMEELEKEISTKGEEHLARLSKELSSLSKLILETKHQQPASEFLQDIRSTLQGYKNKEKFETSVAFPPALKWKIWDFCDIGVFLEGIMEQFRASLESGLQQEKAHVTLDPDTAHPRLSLSEDLRRVINGEKEQDLPDNPERFSGCPYVLGQQGFTGGRHFWEVLVENGEEWSVGVATKSVQKNGSDLL